MNRTLVSCFCLLLSLAPSAVFAQSQTTPKSEGSRIVTVTRLVAIFSDLESQWLRALQQKDQSTLNRLLAEDLQVWTPAPPGDPIPREDWLKQASADRLESFHIRQMAVRSLNDDVTLASFVLNETVERAGKPATYDYFVVDVWHRDANQWQVTDRYVSKVAGASQPAQTSVKPSGRN
jgi:ketosteroid isomerase-like protein